MLDCSDTQTKSAKVKMKVNESEAWLAHDFIMRDFSQKGTWKNILFVHGMLWLDFDPSKAEGLMGANKRNHSTNNVINFPQMDKEW